MDDDFENWLSEREKEAPSDDGSMLHPGQRIGAYRIVRQLGVGGMGQVYEAEHVALGVRRALKVFSTESEHSEFLRKRFVAEGRILADLQHPRIVRVYDLVVDEDSGMAYFEMDLVLSPDGQPRTLADELQDGVDEEKVVGWFKDICEGLAYIHSQGVVHRDISLDNILIGRDGRAVITDFGIAKIIDDSYRKKIDVTVTMVYKDGSEVRIGKERYMAPELKKPNGKASFATDAWALGVLLFRMLSGTWYDVGTRLEDWRADFTYDWHPVLLRLFNPEPMMRLGDGGIAALPALLLHGEAAIKSTINLEYDVETDKVTGKKTITIVKARKAEGDFTIPSEINGCSVVKIGRLAFADCGKMTSVAIPPGVTSIGRMAFYGCDGIVRVTIPDGVTSIGEKAFSGCHSLTSVTMPPSVTSIGDGAFEDCDGLRKVTVPQCVCSNSMSSVFPTACFSDMDVVILDGVKSIGDNAFSYCRGIVNLTMPDSVTSIGDNAFYDCCGLKSVTMSDGVTSVGLYAFNTCKQIRSVTISQYVCNAGMRKVFPDSYQSITSVKISESVTSVGSGAFEGCSDSIFDIKTIPGVKLVDGWAIGCMGALSGRLDLTGVRGIGDCAFDGCNGLSSVMIPDGVTSIGYRVFMGCSGLTSITMPNSVTSIGELAFYGCSGLTSVTIPDGVTSIGFEAFACCSGLTSVTIPNSVMSIGYEAFDGCSGLTSITIPNSVTSIGYGAFDGCSGLTSVTIPDSVMSIDNCMDWVFHDSYQTIKEVTISDGVTTIMDRAFEGCSGLMHVTIPDSVTRIGFGAFACCSGLTHVTIPDSVTCIEDCAFEDCSGLTSVTIPDSVTYIGDCAFSGCEGLDHVALSNRLAHIMRISEDELAPGVRWRYSLLSGKAYITGIQEWVITDYDREHHEPGWSWITDLLKHDVITVPSHIDGFPVYSIGIIPFWGFPKLIVAGGVVEIGNYGDEIIIGVWDDDTLPIRLHDVVLPNTLRCICDGAFRKCKIEDLVIPEGCVRIGNRAFDGSPSLRRIAIPKTMESIGDHAFRNCGKLEEIIIESDCCQFGKGILDGCRSIRKISGPLSRQLKTADFM